jgi:hypothetical protein
MPGARIRLVAAAAAAAAGCSLASPPPLARVRRGPAFATPPARLLALPADCRASEPDLCRDEDRAAVDSAARMALEFAGYALVDSELVNLRLGLRHERDTGVEVHRVTWADASADDRRALLDEMEVDGFLWSAISIGPPRGMSWQRTVEVSLRVTRAHDERLVWQSRCAVETGDYHTTERAVELATRCALESATLP